MRVTIKTLQQKVFHIDADETETIGKLKEKIRDAHGHDVNTQKIIYSGKVLLDDKTIASCEIKEKDFLVLMVSKPKPNFSSPGPAAMPAAATTSAPTPPAAAATPPSAPTPPASSPAPAPVPAPAPAPAPAAAPPSTSPASPQHAQSFLTGDALQAAISNMVEMGFPREQVLRAMRASFNNPERAVEYLMTGIPDHLLAETPSQPPQAQAQTPAPPAAAAPPPPIAGQTPAPAANQPQNLFQLAQQQQQQQPGGGGGARPGGLGAGALRDQSQMAQLRELIGQNPALLQPLIQQLAASNPQLGQMLASDPDALLQFLGDLSGGDDLEGGDLPPGVQVVNVTPEEQAAIERLMALGFTREQAAQAYFACDKNEELAANYLFENGFDD